MPSSISRDDPVLKDNSDYEAKEELPQPEMKEFCEAEVEDSDSEDDQIYMRLKGEDVKNPLVGKRQHVFFEEEEGVDEEAEERKRQIEMLKQFKQESAHMMQKAGL